jgi:hypothetical protein
MSVDPVTIMAMGPHTPYSSNWREGTFRHSRAKARVNHMVDASIRIFIVPHSTGEARSIRSKPRPISAQAEHKALEIGLSECHFVYTVINKTDAAGTKSHRTAAGRRAFAAQHRCVALSLQLPLESRAQKKKRNNRAMAIPLRDEPALGEAGLCSITARRYPTYGAATPRVVPV